MKVKTVTPPAAATSLVSLMDGVDPRCEGILLQASASAVSFGTAGQVALTVPTAATFFPINNINDLYVSGDASKTVTVALLP